MHLLLAAAVALTLSAGPEPGGDSKPGKVRCDIQIIHATRGRKFVDPTLKSIKRYLENSFGTRYQAFHKLGRASMPLSKGSRKTKKLPNDTNLSLTYLGADDGRIRLLMDVGGLKTTVKVHDGGLFFQAGRRYKAGMLIVAIRAHALQ